MDSPSIHLTLTAPGLEWPLNVRLRRAASGWVAQVDGAGWPAGIGPSAGAAVRAAVSPLGARAVRAALADVSLLEPSLQALTLEHRAG